LDHARKWLDLPKTLFLAGKVHVIGWPGICQGIINVEYDYLCSLMCNQNRTKP
jgi:hypothetical protein